MLPVVPTRSDKRSSIRHSPVEPDQCLVPIYPERFCMIQVQGIADTGQSKGLTGDQHGCNEPWETIDDVVRAAFLDRELKAAVDQCAIELGKQLFQHCKTLVVQVRLDGQKKAGYRPEIGRASCRERGC